MAEEAEAAPETGPKPPGIVAKLINGVVVFVMCLGAVVAGGFINAKLHPPPEMKLGPEGKITVVEPVKAVLRRGQPKDPAAAPKEPDARALDRGLLRMDPERHTCTWKNEPVTLTVTEFLILQALGNCLDLDRR